MNFGGEIDIFLLVASTFCYLSLEKLNPKYIFFVPLPLGRISKLVFQQVMERVLKCTILMSLVVIRIFWLKKKSLIEFRSFMLSLGLPRSIQLLHTDRSETTPVLLCLCQKLHVGSTCFKKVWKMLLCAKEVYSYYMCWPCIPLKVISTLSHTNHNFSIPKCFKRDLLMLPTPALLS